MEINVSKKHFQNEPAAAQLVELLENSQHELGISNAQVYYKFPIYKDTEGGIVESRLMIISPLHGLLILWTIEEVSDNPEEALSNAARHLDQVYSSILARLIRNKNLRQGRSLTISIDVAIYAPFIKAKTSIELGTEILTRDKDLKDFIRSRQREAIEERTFAELVSTVEGAKGLIRPKERDLANLPPGSKGALAARLEAEINRFDKQQKYAYSSILDGVQRIRGLAGSGKTVLLAMKAALTHLRNPEATIAFTFYTKSLYQHVQRLITRFYREFDDRDPDWTKMQILHAWGGKNTPGMYYQACTINNVEPLSNEQAKADSLLESPFSYACEDLLNRITIKPIYDFIFIDEGQDFPLSFVRLCRSLARHERVLWAYDELQTIFQATTPTAGDVFGTNPDGSPAADFTEDIILYKCYRNPREVIVCAHALGFGFYGTRIVQMLENRDHWEDIGYIVRSGDLKEGDEVIIERPQENSPTAISQSMGIDEVVQTLVYKNFNEEIEGVAESIVRDIEDGLHPDDILVIVADDFNAKNYMFSIAEKLASRKVRCNDVHSDPYGLRDFFIKGHVTLSTVYKAKGNEAFMVYIVGIDTLFKKLDIRKRNTIFTAMTRTKGWVRISGFGAGANVCASEIMKAKKNFPNLVFRYPNESELRIMKRDLQRAAIERQRLERIVDEILSNMSPDEAAEFIRERADELKRSVKQRK